MTTPEVRICALIPTYNNPLTLRAVVLAVQAHLPDVLVVDDGSGTEALEIARQLEREQLAHVVYLPRNGGKGAAVKAGFLAAQQLGFTHALQVDADGQHDLTAIPRFVQAARERPEALILARPIFAEGTPKLRRIARELTNLWVAIETRSRAIVDAMIGFRVYPVQQALAAQARGNRMDFDIEIAVRLVWLGVPVVNLPLDVRYFARDQGGVSHFRPWLDNVAITRLHTRLFLESLLPRQLFRQLPVLQDRR